MSGLPRPSPAEEVLDVRPNRPSRNRWLWLAAAAVAVLALLTWNLTTGQRTPTPNATDAEATTPSNNGASDGDESPFRAETISDLTFVDDRTGFALYQQCTAEVADAFGCGRRLLTTTDRGATWQPVRWLPSFAGAHELFVVLSADDMVLMDSARPTNVIRSEDGGRSWLELRLRRADPAPLSSGGVVILDGPVRCDLPCDPVGVSWYDPASSALHPLPTQPTPVELERATTRNVAMIDDDIVVSGQTPTGGYAAVSDDGGLTWSETRLEPTLSAGQVIRSARVVAAGGTRLFAFVQVFGADPVTTYGFRTDDAGARWTELGWERERVLWDPAVVFDGELVATDYAGQVFASGDEGTRWTPIADLPVAEGMTQGRPDGPAILAIPGPAGPTFLLTFDGRSWESATLLI